VGPEAKLYQKIRKSWSEFSLTRLENLSSLGTPDVLVSNSHGHFFTIELKVTKGNFISFSSHQLAFHVKHPKNTFILAEALGPRAANRFHMYRGSRILELDACGLKLDACCLGLEACGLMLNELGAS
tara:strand:+ start:840 stop:1220 length:381 start_codon:yes stop_codon:yes gene_type:complete